MSSKLHWAILPVLFSPLLQADQNSFGGSVDSMRGAFESFASEKRKSWQESVDEMRAKQEAFEAELAKQWGSETEVSDRKTWVEYTKDRRVKKTVDFENNQIRISVIGDLDQTEMKALVAEQLADMLETRSSEANQEYPVVTDMQNLADRQVFIKDQQPVLAELKAINNEQSNTKLAALLAKTAKFESKDLDAEKPAKTVVTAPRAEDKAPEVKTTEAKKPEVKKPVEKAPEPIAAKTTVVAKKSEPAQQAKPERRATVAIIDLSKKWPLERAKKYRADVERFSEKMGIERSLAYAIIYTESSFNPVAVSGIPAYGLMQVVPTSAGRDVTKVHFGKEEVLSPEYLFTPDKNIEVGTGYLNILDKRYLRKITDPTSRKYCTIAAYNTGAGNVAKAFTGKMNISAAAQVINAMTPQQVYDTLVAKLPYEETQRYMGKVTKIEKQFIGL
ncbi:transglycosylase SLT domain-containing protein [Spongiibacter sp. KMU-158]|uniref:Transglycosylase SLT domain-containing protein n=1 Tax=Spongiibacter pelagi TaxID=2760804 RepID=A0A927BZ71_9GAMM|nr:murein transglycosylase domain-containing protein [Spongiibacter pelagi]MBD2857739.1 transglycosylase SLT domain-containing protein [Spongiibacter pelagi]